MILPNPYMKLESTKRTIERKNARHREYWTPQRILKYIKSDIIPISPLVRLFFPQKVKNPARLVVLIIIKNQNCDSQSKSNHSCLKNTKTEENYNFS